MNCEHRSQSTRILEYLCTGEGITSLEALRKFGSMRLGARIYDLRADGHRIKAKLVTRGKKRVSEYRLCR